LTEALETHLHRQIEHSRRFFWHRLRWRAISGFLPSDSAFELVDVGAGAGLLGQYLQQDRPLATYRFIEPISSLREFLCDLHGKEADANDQADFPDAQFVTLLDVLEHQQDDRDFLASLVAKMQPGSMLLLTVPALQGLWSQWDEALGHFRRYDKQSLLACTEGLPLTVVETSFLFPEMVPLAMVRRRKKVDGGLDVTEESTEFPDLPGVMNDLLYDIGTFSLDLRRRWKTGTSLLMAATVRG
jgi:Methyltransferase domain